tara:strand:- start:41174 stop:42754 length:1581 start_codon:yes stop_codon:yes gene_type:complete
MTAIVFPGKAILVTPTTNTTEVNLPGSRVITYKGKEYVALKHTLEACHFLARIGIEVVSPIRTSYNWPGRYTPYTHQLRTAEFFSNHWRAFCFNEIGTGKTLSALWAADYLMEQGKLQKVMIASTLSTLHTVWADEIFKNFPNRTFVIVHGTPEKRRAALAQDVDFYIINHDGFKTICDWDIVADEKFINSCQLDARDDIDLLILDEGAQFRNQSTDRYEAMMRCLGTRGIWWMTGSPMPNSPTDVWAQARVVCPTKVPKYFSRFRDKVMRPLGPYKWVPQADWEETVFGMLAPVILFRTKDCLDLPPCQTLLKRVEMDGKQKKAYNDLKSTFTAELEEGDITAVNEGVKRMKLVQIACGAVYDSSGNTHIVPTKQKFELLEQTFYDSGRKIIVFAPFKHVLKTLVEFFEKLGVSVRKISGDVAAGERAEIFHAFQHMDLEVIVAHPAAMAHGITLTAAHHIFWWAPVDDNEIYQQANGRISRIGQDHHQTIVQGACSPVEVAIYKRLDQKENMQGLLKELLTTDL